VKWSRVSLKILLPSSPSANLTSNSSKIRAVNVRICMYASCLPMQPKGPVEKGAKASLCLIKSGWVDQREGRKEVAEG